MIFKRSLLALVLGVSLSAWAQVPPSPTAPTVIPQPVTDCTVASVKHSTIVRSGPEGRLPPGTLSTIQFYADFTLTCDYTGGVHKVMVPAAQGVGMFSVKAYGASGGASELYARTGAGGAGASVSTVLNVPAGTPLQVYVGGAGAAKTGGWNGGGSTPGVHCAICTPPADNVGGGGGGGASDVRVAPFDLSSRLLVAGAGGGGGGGTLALGGNGGHVGAAGQPGIDPNDSRVTSNGGPSTPVPSSGGQGGTLTAGGMGESQGAYADPAYNHSSPGLPGALGVGGNFTLGAWVGSVTAGAGGGGFYGGGGGGCSAYACGGGGGGSSMAAKGDAGAQIVDGQHQGNGQVVLTYRVVTKQVTCFEGSPNTLARGKVYPYPSCSAFVTN